MNKETFALEIFSRYGNVKRARNCFLYTAKNVRLTDLYQEDGRAILGWGGSSAFTMLKNALGRGANGSFLTDYSYRLEKAVSSLLDSKRKILCFYKKSAVEEAADFVSQAEKFVQSENQQKSLSQSEIFYKPWILSSDGKSINWSEKLLVILEPPLAWSSELYILAISENQQSGETLEKIKSKFQDEIICVPSPLQAAYARSIYNLIQALQERSEKDWFLWDTVLKNYFVRKGPYLFTKIPQDKYDDFVLHCLDLGILINPNFKAASIVPFGADRGIFTCLKNNPFK